MRRPLYILYASGLIALIACPSPKPLPPKPGPVPHEDILKVTVSSIFVSCGEINDCDTQIAKLGLACTAAVGCANNECQFSLPNPLPPSCECYEHDVRLCPDDNTKLQFCIKNVNIPGGTMWQRNAQGNMCGPTKIPCTTSKEACPDGFVTTQFNGNIDTWVGTGACVPEPSCPAPGTQRPCPSGNPNCPNGVQTWDGNVWSACQAQGCPAVGSKRPCDTGDPTCRFGFQTFNGTDWGPCVADPSPNKGNPCGHCGGTLECDGVTCSKPDPANFGASCGHCGGTFGCDGITCSRPDPANFGASCGHCGGTFGCDGVTCSRPDPANFGTGCGHCGGTFGCDGVTCSRPDPANFGAACGCGNRGRIGCTGGCDGGACDAGKVCTASGQCCVLNQGAACGCGGRGTINCNGTCVNGGCPAGQVCNPNGAACITAPCPSGQVRCGLGACGKFCCSGPAPPSGQGGLPCDVPCTRDPESGTIMCRP